MPEKLPMVLLHGWGSNGDVWHGLRLGLGTKRLIAAPDLPGYGDTDAPSRYTADTLSRILARRYKEPCLVCGWSMGGMMAIAWAEAFPETVRGLVLVSVTPSFIQRPGWLHGLSPNILGDFVEALNTDPLATLSRFYALQAHGGEAAREVVTALRESMMSKRAPTEEVLRWGLALLNTEDLRDRVRNIACPVLVIHGEQDRVCPVGAGKWLRENIKVSRLALHPRAAHVPFISHPTWFEARLEEFIRDVDV